MVANDRKRRRRDNKRGRAVLLLVLTLFVLIGIAVAAATLIRACKISASKRALPFSAGSKYSFTGDGFMYLNGKQLDYLNLADEKKNFSIEVENENANVIGSPMLKAVYGASSVQVVGTPFDNMIEGGIIKIVCGGKYLGAYVENADNSNSLIVYNSAGAQCYRTDFSETTLLDFGFAGSDGSVMYMCELVTTGTAVSTTISTYDLGRESKTGVMYVQGQIVKNVLLTDKSLFAYCTDSLIRFDRATNKEAYRLICRGYECISTSTDGGKVLFMLKHSEDDASPVRVLSVGESSVSDDTVLELPETTGAVSCFLLGSRAAIARANELIIFSAKGEVATRIPFDGEINSAKKLDDTRVLVIRGNDVILYSLKNI